MKKINYAAIGVAAALAMTLSACNMDASTLPTANGAETQQTTEEIAAAESSAPESAQTETETQTESKADAKTETGTANESETQTAAAETPQSGVTFTFTDSGVTASGGSGYEIDGTALKITESGVYTVTGTCADGSITVKKETTGVTLVLSDLTLSSSEGAALSCNKGSEVTLSVSGTVTLTDAEDPADEDSADTEVADAFDGAAIKVKSGASLTVTGSGVLNVDGSAVKNGIKGAEEAVITVSGATVNIKAANKGLACDGELVITGGQLNIQSDDDAIHSETDVTVTGGTIYIRTGDDAIHAEEVLTIGVKDGASGPRIVIETCEEGLEAGKIYLYSGSGSIRASDDGVNAASDVTMDEIAIYVYGGEWSVNADGDGLDAGGDSTANRGGNIYLYGGTVEVYGSANSGNSALDYDGACVSDGGTLLAVGMTGMAQSPSSGVSVTFGSGGMMGGMGGFGGQQSGGSVSIQSGSSIEIRDASGNTLCTATGVKSANSVIFASAELTEGESYTLYVNGTAAATATAAAGNGMGGGMMGGFGGQMPGQGGFNGQTPAQGGEQGQTPQMPGQGGFGGQRPGDGQRPGGGQRPGSAGSAS